MNVFIQVVGVWVVEKQNHVDFLIGDPGADLLGAALGVGQKQLYR